MEMSPKTTDLSPEERDRLLGLWNDHPAMKHLSARVELTDTGQVRAIVDPVEDFHRGGLGTDALNGAAIAGLFDMVIGLTGFLHVFGKRAGVAQLSIQFLRPVVGDRFEVIGKPSRVGRNLVFATAQLIDENGRTCATCDGIVAVSGSQIPAPDNMPI
jgi:uncharacterized protein (TIGR00369 family)